MNAQTKNRIKLETRNQKLARWGEDLAGATMKEKGMQIIALNTRTPYGEIDLIVSDDAGIRFIEVKTRSSLAFGQPETAISTRKLSHM
jgi:putative endonuclease